MKRILLCISVCLVAVLSLRNTALADDRNIFTYSHIDYDGIGVSNVFDNTVVVKARPNISAIVRLYHDRRSDWNNSIIFVGPVVNIDRYHYCELTYGFGRDSDSRRADYLTVELTREMMRYIIGVGFRYSSYPGYTYYTVSPSLKYYITRRFALWGKYFASTDSDNNFDQAWWFDAEVGLTARLLLRSGFTGGNRLYGPEYETLFGGRADMSFSSYLFRIQYTFTEKASVSYLFENVSRESKYTDRKNTLIVDFRF
jgi:hypothetical protein